MLLDMVVPEHLEIAGVVATNPQAGDAFMIEEILRRAREIHREHGGIFGYDFEDWTQAWRELPQGGSRDTVNEKRAA